MKCTLKTRIITELCETDAVQVILHNSRHYEKKLITSDDIKNIITTGISKEKGGTEKSMQDREDPGDGCDCFQRAPAMDLATKPRDHSMHCSGKTD